MTVRSDQRMPSSRSRAGRDAAMRVRRARAGVQADTLVQSYFCRREPGVFGRRAARRATTPGSRTRRNADASSAAAFAARRQRERRVVRPRRRREERVVRTGRSRHRCLFPRGRPAARRGLRCRSSRTQATRIAAFAAVGTPARKTSRRPVDNPCVQPAPNVQHRSDRADPPIAPQTREPSYRRRAQACAFPKHLIRRRHDGLSTVPRPLYQLTSLRFKTKCNS